MRNGGIIFLNDHIFRRRESASVLFMRNCAMGAVEISAWIFRWNLYAIVVTRTRALSLSDSLSLFLWSKITVIALRGKVLGTKVELNEKLAGGLPTLRRNARDVIKRQFRGLRVPFSGTFLDGTYPRDFSPSSPMAIWILILSSVPGPHQEFIALATLAPASTQAAALVGICPSN